MYIPPNKIKVIKVFNIFSLQNRTYGFALQKHTFCKAKGMVWGCKTIPLAR